MQATNSFQIKTKMLFCFSCETLQTVPPLSVNHCIMKDVYDKKTCMNFYGFKFWKYEQNIDEQAELWQAYLT